MEAEIHGLFYRYKSRGGFEYVADFFIGPRSPRPGESQVAFSTRSGDSGALWLIEPRADEHGGGEGNDDPAWRPLAVQWGANRLYSALGNEPQAFGLATCRP